jgi:hypothetical protein
VALFFPVAVEAAAAADADGWGSFLPFAWKSDRRGWLIVNIRDLLMMMIFIIFASVSINRHTDYRQQQIF